MADDQKPIIQLFFGDYRSELDRFKFVLEGEAQAKRTLGTGKRSELRVRKLCILGLIVCKLRNSNADPLPKAKHWDDLLRSFKNKKGDPRSKWVVGVFQNRVFDFYEEPEDATNQIAFQSSAHSRIEISVGGEQADDTTLRELAIHYRAMCVPDADSVLTKIVGSEAKKKQIRDAAIRESKLQLSPNMGVLIGKYVWYSRWKDLSGFLDAKGGRSVISEIETELGERLKFVTAREDAAPVRDLYQGFRDRFMEICSHMSVMLEGVQDEITNCLTEFEVEGHADNTPAASVPEALSTIDRSIEEWLLLLPEDLAEENDSQEEIDSARAKITDQLEKLRKALTAIEIVVLRRENECKDALRDITSELALAPSSKVKDALGW